MNFQEILIFAIGLNITSGVGAFAFAYMDDSKGAKPTIMVSLIALIGLGIGIGMGIGMMGIRIAIGIGIGIRIGIGIGIGI